MMWCFLKKLMCVCQRSTDKVRHGVSDSQMDELSLSSLFHCDGSKSADQRSEDADGGWEEEEERRKWEVCV